MAKLHCPTCEKKFEYSWWKWILKAPFHFFGRRLTKCPFCGAKHWIRKDRV